MVRRAEHSHQGVPQQTDRRHPREGWWQDAFLAEPGSSRPGEHGTERCVGARRKH